MTSSITNKLALQNLKNNKKTILPYIISSVIIIALFYILTSITHNPDIKKLTGAEVIEKVLYLGQVVVTIFLGIFTMSTYTFLLKQRSKEMGLYSVLGINKFNILKILSLETIYIALITVGSGILTGILFDKLFYLLFTKMIGGEVKLGFHISSYAILLNAGLFAAIYFLILLFLAIKIKRLSVVGLLKDSASAEKEPKARIIMVIVALALIGYGYYTSLHIESPIKAIMEFFYAVLAVIIGTYLLFASVTVAILKLLKNNKSLYYRTKNFISISNLLFRMKRNAVSLANITILSTMILVTVGATSSLYFGVKDKIDRTGQRDVIVQMQGNDNFVNKFKEKAEKILTDNNIEIEDKHEYAFSKMVLELTSDGAKINSDVMNMGLADIDKYISLSILDLDTYNKLTSEKRSLNDGEIFLKIDKENAPKKSSFKIHNKDYKVVDSEKDINIDWSKGTTTGEIEGYYVVVKNKEYIDEIGREFNKYIKKPAIETIYGFNLKDKSKETFVLEKFKEIENIIFNVEKLEADENGLSYGIGILGKDEIRKVMNYLYGSFLFIGLIISTIFLVTQVVIMYYKQLAEGYEDRDKFQIMQKLGLEEKEIKSSISGQVILVFFLPLLIALVHTLFASPMIEKILIILSLGKNEIFVTTMLLTALVFAIGYFIIYKLTSRLYYNIVRER